MTILTILALMLGVVFWVFLYGLEVAINGGTIGYSFWGFIFALPVFAYEELKWHLPGSYMRKFLWCRKIANDDLDAVRLAASLPGPIHFFFMHILVPLSPTIVLWDFFG